ncbi:MAG: hypothetical protein OHK0015_38650 [Chloroflexi bacterium OHK40]
MARRLCRGTPNRLSLAVPGSAVSFSCPHGRLGKAMPVRAGDGATLDTAPAPADNGT